MTIFESRLDISRSINLWNSLSLFDAKILLISRTVKCYFEFTVHYDYRLHNSISRNILFGISALRCSLDRIAGQRPLENIMATVVSGTK